MLAKLSTSFQCCTKVYISMETQTNMQCIGFIMDGNRRWAREQGLPTLDGHKKGHEVFQECARWVRDMHIPHAVFYAFSTENWNRKPEEVAHLMDLFQRCFRSC